MWCAIVVVAARIAHLQVGRDGTLREEQRPLLALGRRVETALPGRTG